MHTMAVAHDILQIRTFPRCEIIRVRALASDICAAGSRMLLPIPLAQAVLATALATAIVCSLLRSLAI